MNPAACVPAAAASVDNRDPAIDTLARTLWGEARGEPTRGIEAVAAVVINRVARARAKGGFWWGDTVIAVCRKPFQFSCWNADDPNLAKLLAVRAGEAKFDLCLNVARQAVSGQLADPTGGATHYHARSVRPAWAAGRSPTVEIGSHLFYANVE